MDALARRRDTTNLPDYETTILLYYYIIQLYDSVTLLLYYYTSLLLVYYCPGSQAVSSWAPSLFSTSP